MKLGMNKFIWIILILIGACPQILAQTSTFTGTNGLELEIEVINECNGNEDGAVRITVTNLTSPDTAARLTTFFNLDFSEQASGDILPLNVPVVITGSSLPGLPADTYNFVVNSDNTGGVFGSVNLFNLSEPTITVNTPPTDLENDDPTCTVLDAQINVTLSGGSLPLAGGGNLNYQITSDNPIPGTSGDTQSLGTTTLDFATLLNGGSPLPGGTYTLTVTDAFSSCGSVVYQATVDDQAPTDFTISTATDSVCENQDIVITVDQTEENVNYEIFVNGTSTGFTGIGPGAPNVGDPINITIPSSFGYTSLDPISVLGSLGSCTSVFMNDTLEVRVDFVPDLTLGVVPAQPQICSGDDGFIQVENSEVGVRYQLRNSINALIGSFVIGDGGTINLPTGALTMDSTFNVLATNGACTPVQLTNTATITVDALPDSTLTVTAQDNPICENNSTNIQVANSQLGYNYQLRNDFDNSNIGPLEPGTGGTLLLSTGNLTDTTTFNVEVTNATCPAVELLQLVTVNVQPEPDLTLNVFANSSSVCAGDSTMISVENTEIGVTYALRIGTTVIGTSQAGNNGQLDFSTGPITGDVTFNILADRGACQVPLDNTAPVTVNPLPPNATNPVPSSYCAGAPVIPNISVDDPGPGFRVDWYDSAAAGNFIASGPSITPDTARTFYAEIVNTTTTCVSANRVAVTVTENPRPTATVTIDGNSTVCSNDSTKVIFTFTGTTPLRLNFVYHIGSNVFVVNDHLSSTFEIPNAQSGDYFIRILSDANTSCVANAEDRGDTATVTVVPAPIVNDLTPSVCEDAAGSGQATVDLTALQPSINTNAGLTFNWYADSTLITLVPDPTNALVTLADSVFFAEVDDGTCSAVARVDYIIESLPEANNLTLMVCEDGFGSDQVNVNLVDLQDSIDGGSAHTILWFSDSLVTPVPDPANVLVTSTANLFFALVDNGTCTNVARVDYTVNGLPANAVNPRDSSYCAGSAVVGISVDDPGGIFQVDWYDAGVGGNFVGSGSTFVPSAPGDYFAEIVNTVTNCVSPARVQATLTEIPAPTANNLSLEVCEDNFGLGQALVNLVDLQDSIDGGAGNTFAWFSDSLVTAVPDPANVLVTATDNQFFAQVSDTTTFSCTSVARVDYMINSLPLDATTTADSVSYCAGSTVPSISVDAPGPGRAIEWYDAATGGTLVANGISFIPSAPGQYFAQVVNTTTNCVSENRLAITLVEIPLPTATVDEGGAVCPGDPLPDVRFIFTGTPPFNFTYSDGSSLQNELNYPATVFVINNAPVGTYSITALSDSTTCNAAVLGDSVVVEVSPLPTPTFQMPDSIVCFGDTIVYTTQPAKVNYVWSVTGGDVITGGSASDSTLSVAWNGTTPPFEVSINYEDTTGCVAATPTILAITVNPLPAIFNVIGTATICAGDSTLIELDGSENGTQYDLFRDGVLVESIVGDGNPIAFNLVGTAGNYTVEAENATTNCRTTMTGNAVVTVIPIAGDPTIFGNDTWIGYVYDESANAPPPAGVSFDPVDYRGFITGTEIDTFNTGSFYDATTDEFDFNLATAAIEAANLCGTYNDLFSIRFRMRKNFTAGEYTFTIGSNDGKRLFIDGNPVVNDFVNQGFSTNTITVCLDSGNHELVLEYYENTGNSRVSFEYVRSATPSVAISVNQNPACINDEVTFTATPTNGGLSPSYQWFVNSALVSSGPDSVFRTSTLRDSATVFVQLITGVSACTTVQSDTIIMGIDSALVASVSINAIPNPVCIGDSIRFSANPVNGGPSPLFQWRVNGVDVPGATGLTFASNSLADSSVVQVEMTADTTVSCITNSPVLSDSILARVESSLVASVTINGPNTVCSGDSARFEANPVNGGTSPTYQWRLNGSDLTGETGQVLVRNNLNDMDSIDVIMTADPSATCVTNSPVASNVIGVRVATNLAASVSIVSDKSTICPGESVTFRATSVVGGTSPTFQWLINGVNVAGATDTTFVTVSLNNLDSVQVEMTADASATCITGSPVLSNTIGIGVADLLIVQDPTQGLCPGDSVEIIASGFDTYEFIDFATNTLLQSSSSDSTYSDVFDNGQVIEVVANSTGCGPVSDTIVVDLRPFLSLTQSPNPALCLGDSISIEATPGYDTYTFRDVTADSVMQSGMSNIFLSTGLSDGQSVEVEASSTACGTILDTLEVNINSQVLLVQDSLTRSCPGDTVRLVATPGFDSYDFLNGLGGPALVGVQGSSINVFLTTALNAGQIVEVVARSSCGTARDSIIVELTPFLSLSQSPNPGLCGADSISITAKTGFDTYVFRDIAADSVMQSGASAVFTSAGFIDGQSVEVAATSSTCGSTVDTLDVNVNNTFEVVLVQDSLTRSCPGDTVRLIATPGFDSYQFLDGLGGPVLTGVQDSLLNIFYATELRDGQIVEVVATSTECGTAQDSILAELNPVIALTQSPSVAQCEGDTVRIIATEGYSSYIFRDIAADSVMQSGSSNIFVSTGLENNQSVEVAADLATCGSILDTLVVNINTNFGVELLQDPTTRSCPGDSVRLVATAGFDNYEFFDVLTSLSLQDSADSIYYSTNFTNGQLIRVVASSPVCGDFTDTLRVDLDPFLSLVQAPDLGLCPGDSISIEATQGYTSYVFRDIILNRVLQSDTSHVFRSIDLSDGQQIEVTANSATCGMAVDTLTVNLRPLLTVRQNPAQGTCPGDSTTLIATPGYDSYVFRNFIGGGVLRAASADSTFRSPNFVNGQLVLVEATSATCGDTTAIISVNVLPGTAPACGGGVTCDLQTLTIQPGSIVRPDCGRSNGSFSIEATFNSPQTQVTYVISYFDNDIGGFLPPREQFNNPSFDSLAFGRYEYYVRVGSDTCITPLSFFLSSDVTVKAVLEPNSEVNISCFGETGSARLDSLENSSTGEYYYSINGGTSWERLRVLGDNTVNGLPAGTTTILVGESPTGDQCPAEVEVTLTSASVIDADITPADVSDCGNGDGSIAVDFPPRGGSIPNGQWEISLEVLDEFLLRQVVEPFGPFDADRTFGDLSEGNYIVTLRDEGGCEREFQNLFVNSPNQVDFNVFSTSPTCDNSGSDGTLLIEMGGTNPPPGPFVLIVTQGADESEIIFQEDDYDGSPERLIGLPAGIYNVTIDPADNQLCPRKRTEIITGGPEQVSFDFELVCMDDDNIPELRLFDIRGAEGIPLLLNVYQSGQLFGDPVPVPIDTRITDEFIIENRLFLNSSNAVFRLELTQAQPICTDPITFIDPDPSAVLQIPADLLGEMGEVTLSLPERPTGQLTVNNINGGMRPYVTYLELTVPNPSSLIFDYEVGPDTVFINNSTGRFDQTYTDVPAGDLLLTIEDAIGCIHTIDYTVPIDQSIFIPNVFTPNGDDANERFEVRNLKVGAPDERAVLVITNRWGNIVYESGDYNNDWNGEDTPDGVYFYKLQARGEVFTGWVEIIRGQP